MLAAQGRLEDARSFLSAALAKDPRNLRYRLALARLIQRQGQGPDALRIIDQAEKELGPGPEIQLARLDYWASEGGGAAKAAVDELAGNRQQIPAADRPAFLDRLGGEEARLGGPDRGRRYWRELAALGVFAVRNPDFFDFKGPQARNPDGSLRPRHGFHTLPDGTLTPLHVIMALVVAHDGTVYATTIYPFTLLRVPAVR